MGTKITRTKTACKTRRRPGSTDARILAETNRVQVSKADLLEFIKEYHTLPAEDRDYDGRVITAIRLHSGNPDKAGAIMHRAEALAYLVAEEGAPGWTLPPQPDGAVFTEDVVFAAAVAEPLVLIGGRVRFNRQRFLERVLTLAQAERGIH